MSLADPFAPVTNRLDERLRFSDKTRIKDELRELVRLVEARLARLESFVPDWISVVNGITAEQNQRLMDSIGAQAAQITAWAAEAQQGAEDALYAAAQAGAVDAMSFVRRDGSQNFTNQASGIAPGAGARNSLLATAGWVGGEVDTAVAANAAADRAYADAAVAALNGTLVGSAPESMNTIGELASALNNAPSFGADMNTALALRLRVDANQTLTATQRGQALKNLGQSVLTATGAFSIILDDNGRTFLVSAAFGATWTLGHAITAATAGAGFRYYVKNTSLATITIDPSGAETIDGATTLAILAKQEFWVVSTGTAWITVGRRSIVPVGYANVTSGVTAVNFLLPPGYVAFDIEIMGFQPGTDATQLALQVAFDAAGTAYLAGANYFYNLLYGTNGTPADTMQAGVTSFSLARNSVSAYPGSYRGVMRPDSFVSILGTSTVVSSAGGATFSEVNGGFMNAGAPRATGLHFFTGSTLIAGDFLITGRAPSQ